MRLHSLTSVTAVILLATATPALSAEPLDNVYACATIADSTQRLACFDAAVAGLRKAETSGEVVAVTRDDIAEVEKDAFGFSLPSLPRLGGLFRGGERTRKVDTTPKGNKLTAPVVTPEARPAETPAPVRSAEAVVPDVRPAAPARPRVELEEITSITQTLARTKPIGVQKTRFYLANGQVWDQVDTKKVRVPRERDGRTNTVEIRKAALGSYLLQVNGKGSAIRVQRRR